jgi:hypothetical protein
MTRAVAKAGGGRAAARMAARALEASLARWRRTMAAKGVYAVANGRRDPLARAMAHLSEL